MSVFDPEETEAPLIPGKQLVPSESFYELTGTEASSDKNNNALRHRTRSFLLACLSAIANGCLSNMITPIKRQVSGNLNIPEMEELGFLGRDSLVFYSSGFFSAFIFGFLTSVVPRKFLMLIANLLGAISCGFLPLARSPENFLAWRFVGGLGYGAIFPVMLSLVGDWYTTEERRQASGLAISTAGVGTLLGYFISTVVNGLEVFYIFAAMLVLSAAAYVAFGTEPVTGGVDLPPALWRKEFNEDLQFYKKVPSKYVRKGEGTFARKGGARTLRIHLYTLFSATNIAIMLLSFPGFLPIAMSLVFFDKIAWSALLAFTAGIFLSTVAGGMIGDYLARFGRQPPVAFAGVCVLMRVWPLWAVIVWKKESSEGYMLMLGLMSYLHASTTTTMLLNGNLPELRGSVAGLSAALEDVSRAAGPALLKLLLEGTRLWNIPDSDRQRLIISAFAMIWLVIGAGIVYISQKVHSEELRVKDILEAEARAAVVDEQKHLSRTLLDSKVKEVVKATSRKRIGD